MRCLLVLVLLAGCSSGLSPTPSTATSAATTTTIATTTSGPYPTACTYGPNASPDPVCTPGAFNPDVTQQTIGTTICVPGWTATIRPPTSVTGPIKTERMAAYGDTLPRAAYELDHLIPLELGGAPRSILNLWPEPFPAASVKDALENKLKTEVCAGTVTLADAQHEVRTP